MKLLLDTHIFLWYISADKKLPADLRDAILSAANEIYFSVASLWEVIIKCRIRKLALPQPPEIYVVEQRERHMILSLSLDEASVKHLAELPSLHRDPFDRMLVCQAIEHNLTIVTVDPLIRAYSVAVL